MVHIMSNLGRATAHLNSRELMNEILHRRDLLRIRMAQCEPRISPPSEVLEFTSRNVPQHPDTIRICPAYPEYMIVGTHHLREEHESREPGTSIRKGLLIIMPVSPSVEPDHAGQLVSLCETREMGAGVEEIQFHPEDPELLGVALSNAKIHFFRLIRQVEVGGHQVPFILKDLHDLVIVKDDIADNGTLATPVVHRFIWITDVPNLGEPEDAEDQIVTLTASTEYGDVVFVQAGLPASNEVNDRQKKPVYPMLSTVVHRHGELAWCSTSARIATTRDHLMIISGGDDYTLRGTVLEFARNGTYYRSHLVKSKLYEANFC